MMFIQLLCFFLFLLLLLQATMSKRSFKKYVEQELGSFPYFLIYTVLEWSLIIFLFIEGLISFLSNQFAKFFDLNIPCLLCTRIDHILVPRDPQSYYNESICDSHKKKVSSLAYCHVHKKLSEIKHMCEGCLLSFATEKDSDCDTYKSLIGILHKDLELLIDDDRELPLAFKKDENFVQTTKNLVDYKTNDSLKQHCTCCGELLKIKSAKIPKNNNTFLAPAPSPRVSYNKLSENESEFKDLDIDRTPSFARGGNKFFGIPLSDSAQNSPRWSVRSFKKPLLEKTVDPVDQNGDSILHQLKKEVRLDKKSLIDLYMELDEERSASAVAANEAMAMITRLQDEKAAVQMEALQYQRMMDEQAEYDQEALQNMNTELVKKEEEMKELEAEIEAYREKYGSLVDEDEFLEEQGNVTTDETRPVYSLNIDGNESTKSQDSSCIAQIISSEESTAENDKENETKPVFEDFNHEDNGQNIDRTRSIKSEDSSSVTQIISSQESTAENDVSAEEEKENESKEGVVKELLEITERLSALQSNGELLKHMADVLDVTEGEAILLQISQNLHMLRSFVAMPSESGNL